MEELDDEAERLTTLLKGKSVKIARRHRTGEIVIEFEDGARLFIDRTEAGLEFSVTSNDDEKED